LGGGSSGSLFFVDVNLDKIEFFPVDFVDEDFVEEGGGVEPNTF
jgi:hypothetical protein